MKGHIGERAADLKEDQITAGEVCFSYTASGQKILLYVQLWAFLVSCSDWISTGKAGTPGYIQQWRKRRNTTNRQRGGGNKILGRTRKVWPWGHNRGRVISPRLKRIRKKKKKREKKKEVN